MRWTEIQRLPDAPTYRQIDWWTRQGLIRANGAANPGTGRSREWSAGEVNRAIAIKRLSDIGIRLDAIATLMSGRPEDGHWRAEVATGVVIDVTYR